MCSDVDDVVNVNINMPHSCAAEYSKRTQKKYDNAPLFAATICLPPACVAGAAEGLLRNL